VIQQQGAVNSMSALTFCRSERWDSAATAVDGRNAENLRDDCAHFTIPEEEEKDERRIVRRYILETLPFQARKVQLVVSASQENARK